MNVYFISVVNTNIYSFILDFIQRNKELNTEFRRS